MSRVVLAAGLLFALCVPTFAQRARAGGFGGARVAMGRPASPMGFARAPQMRPQFFAPRSSAISRPRPAFGPQRRGGFASGRINGGPFFRTRGFDRRARGFDRHFDGDFDDFHRFHHRNAFLFGFPYYYGGYGYPYYGDFWNPDYSFGSYSYDPTANTSYYSDLSGQVNQLDAEVQELRDENDSLRSTLDEQRRPAPLAYPNPAKNEPATVIVYRDGHRAEVQSYAIVGTTLWLLSDTHATKVPLADLDLNQTVKANEDRGLDFPVPK